MFHEGWQDFAQMMFSCTPELWSWRSLLGWFDPAKLVVVIILLELQFPMLSHKLWNGKIDLIIHLFLNIAMILLNHYILEPRGWNWSFISQSITLIANHQKSFDGWSYLWLKKIIIIYCWNLNYSNHLITNSRIG